MPAGKVATLIRNEVEEMKYQMPWPPESNDLDPKKFQIPKYLRKLFT